MSTDALAAESIPFTGRWPGFGSDIGEGTTEQVPRVRARPNAPPLRVLVTIPVRNEAERLIPAIHALKVAFDGSGFTYNIAIAEDGSTDGTKAVLNQLPELFPEIIIQEWPTALGRGKALRELWSRQDADIYCFTDADLASGSQPLAAVVAEVANGWDVVTGSRYTDGSRVRRPPLRFLVSRAYNWLVRVAFSESIRDHQCGLKAFNARAVQELLNQTREDSWFWDTEILVLAHADGLSIKEVPVDWVEKKATRTKLARLGADILLHGSGLLRLKARLPSKGRAPPPDDLGYRVPAREPELGRFARREPMGSQPQE